jgi:glycosyltransferase involved in cell wall biosynthesis
MDFVIDGKKMSQIVVEPFSVLIPVYNGDIPSKVEKALLSIMENDVSPSEVLIIIDGPICVEIQSVISSFCSSYAEARVYSIDCNQGLARALNYGLTKVTTDWVARADADDINLPTRFSSQIPLLQRGYDLIGASIIEEDNDGSRYAVRQTPTCGGGIAQFIRRRNPFNHMTVCFKLQSVLKAGGYPEIEFREDYALWAKMIAMGMTACNLNEVLVVASAGRSMVERRGGLRYLKGEMQLQRHLTQLGLKSACGAIFDFLVRSAVFLLPVRLRYFVYRFYLRSSV